MACSSLTKLKNKTQHHRTVQEYLERLDRAIVSEQKIHYGDSRTTSIFPSGRDVVSSPGIVKIASAVHLGVGESALLLAQALGKKKGRNRTPSPGQRTSGPFANAIFPLRV